MRYNARMKIRALEDRDHSRWHELRTALWPHVGGEDNRKDTEIMLADPHQVGVFVSESDGVIDGFVEVRLRDCANGCDSSPVGFIEGWYVIPSRRRTGVGACLVAAAEAWARARKCSEMGSDAEISNDVGARAHVALGYVEVDRVICFQKAL